MDARDPSHAEDDSDSSQPFDAFDDGRDEPVLFVKVSADADPEVVAITRDMDFKVIDPSAEFYDPQGFHAYMTERLGPTPPETRWGHASSRGIELVVPVSEAGVVGRPPFLYKLFTGGRVLSSASSVILIRVAPDMFAARVLHERLRLRRACSHHNCREEPVMQCTVCRTTSYWSRFCRNADQVRHSVWCRAHAA